MSDNPASPLMEPSEGSRSQRPASKKSTRSTRSKASTTETTPLLSRVEDDGADDHLDHDPSSPAASSLRSLQGSNISKDKKGRRWPSILALIILTLAVIFIMLAAFFAPAIVEEYASQALVIEPTSISIDSFTPSGVRAKINADFMLDASRVRTDAVRNIGRAGTWLAGGLQSEQTTVRVYLPELGNILLGTAVVPGIPVDLRDGHVTHIAILTDIEPGEMDGIRRIANDWLEGRVGQLRLQAKAEIGLKSGFIPLGTHSISESLVFEGQNLPDIPKYNITRMILHEVDLPEGGKGMAADASLTLMNKYPVKATLPPLGFDILVPNCAQSPEPYILLAEASTDVVEVAPKEDVTVDVLGLVRQIPDSLTAVCPNSQSSPLDLLLEDYLHGQDTIVFVRGALGSSHSTPNWISDLISSITVPIPFPGHTFDNLIKNFSLTDVHFSLPDPLAEPDTPEGQPKISAAIKALVKLPKEMELPIDVSHVRAKADVTYKGEKLGYLDLKKWQPANSTREIGEDGKTPMLLVESAIEEAPLTVTNETTFTEVVQTLIFGKKGVHLGIAALVDVKVEAALGEFTVKKIPAEGKVFVKPLSHGFDTFTPKIGSLRVGYSSATTLTIQAKVNFTNPTEYTAHVPFISVNILSNDTILAQAIARDVDVVSGENVNLPFEAVWDPFTWSGELGRVVGRELLSQYISGFNTTLTLQAHEGSIPNQPALGRALSKLALTIPTPRLPPRKPPSDGDGDDGGDEDDEPHGPHFISDATFHLFSSTATFTLLSPLSRTTLYITSINATAYYNHTSPVGDILYDLPFAVPPEPARTPRLPVDWSFGSVGYEAAKSALGGTLKLDTKATVGVRVGNWIEEVWYLGRGIGAKVRI